MTITNLGNIEISDQQLRSALARAALATGATVRADGGYPADMIDQFRERNVAAAVGQIRQDRRGWEPDPELRADAARAAGERADAALSPGPAGFLRDFDYIHREILEERRPQLNAGAMFAADSTVPLGATTHTWRRSVVTGRAKWHTKGSAFPVAKAGYLEEQFRTGYVVCAVEQSFFEGLQIGYAGLQTYRLEAAGAIRAIEEFLNDVVFYGDTARQIYGVLKYPSLAKMVLSTQFGGASTGAQVVAALHALVNKPSIVSGSVFRPNRIAVPEAVHAYLATTYLDPSGGTTTLKRAFLEGQSGLNGIRDIEIARELSATEMTAKGVGNPAGYHGILVWNDAKQSIHHVLPQRPTFLPIWQSSPIDTLHVAFAATGGVVAPDVGDPILGFVSL